MEPRIYRLRADLRDRELNRHIRRLVIANCVILLAIFLVTSPITRLATMSQLTSHLKFLGFFTFTFVLVTGLQTLWIRKRVYSAYRNAHIVIDDFQILRRNGDAPDVSVRFDEVITIEEKPGNGMMVRGKRADRRVWMACELESFPEIREEIIRKTGVVPKDGTALWKNPLFPTYCYIVAWVIFCFSKVPLAFAWAIVIEAILIYQIVSIRRNPNCDPSIKRMTNWNIVTAVVVLFQLVLLK